MSDMVPTSGSRASEDAQQEAKIRDVARRNGETWAYPNEESCGNPGMTLREYYAGQALASLSRVLYPMTDDGMVGMVRLSVALADALLLELARTAREREGGA